jgi:ribosome biogenesis GTPase A
LKGTPFRTSGRVSGEGFFGRSELIRAVIRNLRARNNVAIVGAPRMGRSSLINLLFKNYKRAERDVLTWFADLLELATLEDL